MYIVVDIGGTNTRVAASKDGRGFSKIEKFKTPKKFEHGLAQIVAGVKRVQGAQKIKGLAVAVPGSIDSKNKALLNLPNLPGWSNKPITKVLTRHLNCKMRLINDADAAGLGEAAQGAGRGYTRVAYFTISTGIGGARLVHGKLDPKFQNWEPGHFVLVPHGRKCGCGRRGCFESYASGTGFYKTYGIHPENCKNQTIWNKYAQTLGRGIVNALRHDPPNIIVIGGGVSQAGERLFKPLRAYLKNNFPTQKPPPIKKAALGDLAGLYGCLALFKGRKNFS
ncbi:ROK family protein [Candidatus Uhrbacteria bacterium]|nr:ROK family protein [Candidatus Uhrbacteria bacterium]